jgi:integrase
VAVDVGGTRSRTAAVWVTRDLRVGVRVWSGERAVLEVAEFCRVLAERFTVREISYDPWRFRSEALRLEATFGAWTLAEFEGAADDIARWRAGLTETSRYRLTLALRQVLGAAVRWRYMTRNPAVEAGRNPEPRGEELLAFTPAEVDALEAELGPAFGPLVTFAAETGLRTNEWVALERRDVDRSGPAVLVQRRYADGTLTPYPKTVGSRRRVPLSARALAALDRLPPRLDTTLVFPAARGGHIGLDGWRTRHWYPALEAAGIRQRGPYQLRHTFATEALAAGISIFELARVMGTSVKMIDRTYGHLARDSEDAIRTRLDAQAGRSGDEVATGPE